MARSSVGFGASVGQNWGGGGVIYVSNLNPIAGGPLPPSGFFQFTIGVHGSLIDITKVQITINASELAFDGTLVSGPAFQGLYGPLSSYSYSVPDNGYTFIMARSTGFTSSPVTVLIHAETTDGATSDQTYQFISPAAAFVYPPTLPGVPLGVIPLSRFTGEYNSGLLAGAAGAVFFSPALLTATTGTSIDIDYIEMRDHAGESYALQKRPQPDNSHPFLWGPGPGPIPPQVFPPQPSSSYKPVWNSPIYTFLKSNQRTAIGVLTNTTTHVSQIIIV